MTDFFLVEYHFGQNKSERWLGKMDLQKAKQIYLQEVETAGLLSKEEMNSLYASVYFVLFFNYVPNACTSVFVFMILIKYDIM